jgi:hypothetical protein
VVRSVSAPGVPTTTTSLETAATGATESGHPATEVAAVVAASPALAAPDCLVLAATATTTGVVQPLVEVTSRIEEE